MTHLPSTVIANDDPTGRAGLVALAHAGLLPSRLFIVGPQTSGATASASGETRPGLRTTLARWVDRAKSSGRSSTKTSPRNLSASHPRLLDAIATGLADVTPAAEPLIDALTKNQAPTAFASGELAQSEDELAELLGDVPPLEAAPGKPSLYLGNRAPNPELRALCETPLLYLRDGCAPFCGPSNGVAWSLLTRRRVGATLMLADRRGLAFDRAMAATELPPLRFDTTKAQPNELDDDLMTNTMDLLLVPLLRSLCLVRLLEDSTTKREPASALDAEPRIGRAEQPLHPRLSAAAHRHLLG